MRSVCVCESLRVVMANSDAKGDTLEKFRRDSIRKLH